MANNGLPAALAAAAPPPALPRRLHPPSISSSASPAAQPLAGLKLGVYRPWYNSAEPEVCVCGGAALCRADPARAGTSSSSGAALPGSQAGRARPIAGCRFCCRWWLPAMARCSWPSSWGLGWWRLRCPSLSCCGWLTSPPLPVSHPLPSGGRNKGVLQRPPQPSPTSASAHLGPSGAAGEITHSMGFALDDARLRQTMNQETRLTMAIARRFTAGDYLQAQVGGGRWPGCVQRAAGCGWAGGNGAAAASRRRAPAACARRRPCCQASALWAARACNQLVVSCSA
jgi:hypothetical protein